MLPRTHPVTPVCTGTRPHMCTHVCAHSHGNTLTWAPTCTHAHTHDARIHAHLCTHSCAHTHTCLTPQDTCAEDPAPCSSRQGAISHSLHPPHGQLRPGGSRTHAQSLQGARWVHVGALGPGRARHQGRTLLPSPRACRRTTPCPRSSPESPALQVPGQNAACGTSSECPCSPVKAGGAQWPSPQSLTTWAPALHTPPLQAPGPLMWTRLTEGLQMPPGQAPSLSPPLPETPSCAFPLPPPSTLLALGQEPCA